MWVPALLYEPEKLSGQGPRRPERQRPRPGGQGGEIQANPLHQPGQARHDRPERRVVRHGPAANRRLRPRADEPDRPVRIERPGAVLPGDEARPRRAAVAGTRGPGARGGDGPVRRRLADDLHQRPGHAGDADRPGGRLLQLQDAGPARQRPRRSGADADRPGDPRRLHPPDGDDGAAADAADVQRQRQLLLRGRLRPAAAAARRRAGLPPLRQGEEPALPRQPRPRHARL